MTTIAITSLSVTPTEKTTLKTIDSISLPGGISPPKGRFTGLYGTRSALDLLSETRRKAMRDGKSVFRIDLKVDGGDNADKKIDDADVASTRFLNLNRITVNLESLLLRKMQEAKVHRKATLADMILDDPTLFFDTFWSMPEYKHINLVVFETRSDFGKPVRYRILRDPSVVLSVEIRGYKKKMPELKFYGE